MQGGDPLSSPPSDRQYTDSSPSGYGAVSGVMGQFVDGMWGQGTPAGAADTIPPLQSFSWPCREGAVITGFRATAVLNDAKREQLTKLQVRPYLGRQGLQHLSLPYLCHAFLRIKFLMLLQLPSRTLRELSLLHARRSSADFWKGSRVTASASSLPPLCHSHSQTLSAMECSATPQEPAAPQSERPAARACARMPLPPKAPCVAATGPAMAREGAQVSLIPSPLPHTSCDTPKLQNCRIWLVPLSVACTHSAISVASH